jgi:hypothetical protein
VKITMENWKSVERAVREGGVQDTSYDSDGRLTTIILKSGECYELTMDVLQQLIEAGLIDVKLGRRVNPNAQ